MSLKSKAYKLTALSLLLAPMALSTFQSVTVMAEDSETETPAPTPIPEGHVRTHLHKLLNTSNSGVQNTGLEMNAEDFYDEGEMIKLPGVTFVAFDISTLYYTLRVDAGSSAHTIFSFLEHLNYRVSKTSGGEIVLESKKSATEYEVIEEAIFVDEIETTTSGIATFDLPEKTTVNDKEVDAIYLFLETDAPAVVTQKASPMVLGLPAYVYDAEAEAYTDEKLSEIHLYPKNKSQVGNLYGEKVIRNYNPETKKIVSNPLVGAEFVIHQGGTNINDYAEDDTIFLGEADSKTGVRPWVTFAQAEVFETDDEGKLVIEGLAKKDDYLLSEISDIVAGNEIGKTSSVINAPFEIDLEVEDGADYDFEFENELVNDDIVVEKDNPGGSLAFGEAETYTVKTMVPSGMNDTIVKNGEVKDLYSHFTFTDIHDEWLVLDEDSISVTVDGEEISSDAYVVAPLLGAGVGKTGFSINFEDPRGTLGQYAGQIIQVSYDMSIDPEATADVSFDNLVKVSTDWDYNTDKGEKVFTGGRKFIKVDGHSGAELKGAKFNISDAAKNGNLLYVDATGNYKFLASATEGYTLVELTSDDNGLFEIQGLKYGTYYLQEIAVPDSTYILPDGRFEFVVEAGSYENSEDFNEVSDEEQEIKNFSKGTLPSTGGMGTIVFFLVGAVAMTGVVAVSRKKKA